MEHLIQKVDPKTPEGNPVAVLLYMDDRWYFMGEETQDPSVVLACLFAIPLLHPRVEDGLWR